LGEAIESPLTSSNSIRSLFPIDLYLYTTKESIYFILEILALLSYWKYRSIVVDLFSRFVVFGKTGELFEV
jgi:hypothetical protein